MRRKITTLFLVTSSHLCQIYKNKGGFINMHYYCSRIVIGVGFMLSIIGSPTLQSEEYRAFTNTSGQAMKAVIVSATETEVTLKREDGREVTGGISFFSPEDQAFIKEWLIANPSAISYDFDVKVTKERVDRSKTQEGNLIVVYETWKYKIVVENRSKSGNAGTSVSGIEMHYNLLKTAKSRAREASALQQKLKSAGSFLVEAGKADLGTIEYLRTQEAETTTIPINHSELAPGWYYADGSRDEHGDELDGISIQLLKDGKVINTAKIGSKAAGEAKWISPAQ